MYEFRRYARGQTDRSTQHSTPPHACFVVRRPRRAAEDPSTNRRPGFLCHRTASVEHAADTANAPAVDHHFSSSKSEALLLVYAFCVVFCSAPAVWNSLPKTVLGSDSVALKQHLVSYRKCREPLRMRHHVARSKARHESADTAEAAAVASTTFQFRSAYRHRDAG